MIGTDGLLTTIGAPDWLVHPPLQSLMAAFEDAGHQIYAVGGCVRDAAMDRPVKDVDLSTDARPDQTTKIIDDMGWKSVPTGIDHGTVTAVPPKGAPAYEITTFRKDVETDGRHAVVAFSDRIEDDAMRRDFTINAFYADRTGAVRDVVGGSTDLARRHIRFIGDPTERIREDYLRILRFFRFTGSHGASEDGVDADGLSACAMLADGLDGVSRERIGMEFTRIVSDMNAAPTVGMMEHSGVLGRILPGAGVVTLARLIDLEETSAVAGIRDMPTRLASLGCEDVAERLRLSKRDAAKVDLVRKEAGTLTPAHELGYRHGYLPALQCLLLRWAVLLQPFDEVAQADAALGAKAKFPVSAPDLMPKFSGKALGDQLKMLESAWIKSRFSFTRDDLLKIT
ncbi:CCA tRNA nucleotidyltransferase [Pseudooctadecabacter sp.]|uniref:CCA tRNA nucleotidyltransferase n=1 Tax=Pseudooctadecabacter sp. TaxID=1966338 RepID=UPI0035C80AF7